MAQGKLKLRSGRKTAPKKGKKRSSSKPVRRRKATKPLKGRTIVPKKAAKRKAAKQRKNLQKKVTERIEQDLVQQAVRDGNELRILSSEELTPRAPDERKDILRKC